MTTTANDKPGFVRLVEDVLRRLDQPGSRAHLAAIRSGITPLTEIQAMPYTESYLAGASPLRATGARRAAAITAMHATPADARAVRDGLAQRVGTALRSLHHKETGTWPGEKANAISASVGALPVLDVESAAQVLSGLVGRAAAAGVRLDYIDLTWTLALWGTGIDERSAERRKRVVTDFYRPARDEDRTPDQATPAA